MTKKLAALRAPENAQTSAAAFQLDQHGLIESPSSSVMGVT
jgi:hypothetical protein